MGRDATGPRMPLSWERRQGRISKGRLSLGRFRKSGWPSLGIRSCPVRTHQVLDERDNTVQKGADSGQDEREVAIDLAIDALEDRASNGEVAGDAFGNVDSCI